MENQPRLNNFKLNLILTCNIIIHAVHEQKVNHWRKKSYSYRVLISLAIML